MNEGMFEIYTKEATINGKLYKVRPLSGRFLPKLYAVLEAFNAVSNGKEEDLDASEVMKALDEKTVLNLHELSVHTLEKSYPDIDRTVLDEFVSQNLLSLMEALVSVNVSQNEDKSA